MLWHRYATPTTRVVWDMISKELLTDLPCLLAVMLKLTSDLLVMGLESLSINGGILILVGVYSVYDLLYHGYIILVFCTTSAVDKWLLAINHLLCVQFLRKTS